MPCIKSLVFLKLCTFHVTPSFVFFMRRSESFIWPKKNLKKWNHPLYTTTQVLNQTLVLMMHSIDHGNIKIKLYSRLIIISHRIQPRISGEILANARNNYEFVTVQYIVHLYGSYVTLPKYSFKADLQL